jgi:very-short-patch-repair endonuclease
MLALPDLVAAGDHFIRRGAAVLSAEELGATALAWGTRRGARRLRQAAGLLDDRAESRPETLLRLILHDAGLVDVQINRTFIDSETGRRVRPDFVFPAQKVAIEYQGDYHRTREQWRADMTRRSRLEAQGWIVIEVNADDLRDPAELTRRILSVLARRGRP